MANRNDCTLCDMAKDYGLGWFSMHKCGICGEDFGCHGFSLEIRNKNRNETATYDVVCPVCQRRIFKTMIECSQGDDNRMRCQLEGE